MSFQTSDLSANLFSFGDLKIFINSQMTKEHINSVKSIDSGYVPRTKNLLNRTVVHLASRTVAQLDIQLTLGEVVLPPNQGFFKTGMFKQIINFMLMSIKKFAAPNAANEMGFKILFYAPTGSPASDSQWWGDTGIATLGWTKSDVSYGQTVLGVPLSTTHTRYVLWVWLDENYNLIKEPVCAKCKGGAYPSGSGGSGWGGAVPDSGGLGTWSTNSNQPRTQQPTPPQQTQPSQSSWGWGNNENTNLPQSGGFSMPTHASNQKSEQSFFETPSDPISRRTNNSWDGGKGTVSTRGGFRTNGGFSMTQQTGPQTRSQSARKGVTWADTDPSNLFSTDRWKC